MNGTDDMDTSPSPPIIPLPLLNTSNQSTSSLALSATTPPLLSQSNLPILSPFVTNNSTHPTTTKSQSGPTNSSTTSHSGLELSMEPVSMSPMMMMTMQMPPMGSPTTASVSCRVKVEPMESTSSSPPLSESNSESLGPASLIGPNTNSDLSNVALIANSGSNSCYGTL